MASSQSPVPGTTAGELSSKTIISTVLPISGLSSGKCRVSDSSLRRMRTAFIDRPPFAAFYRVLPLTAPLSCGHLAGRLDSAFGTRTGLGTCLNLAGRQGQECPRGGRGPRPLSSPPVQKTAPSEIGGHGRVALGGYPPRAPTDPYVRN